MSDLESMRATLVCARFENAQAKRRAQNVDAYLNDLEERIDAIERAQSEAKTLTEPEGLYASRYSVYVLRDSAGCLYRLRDGCWQVRLPDSRSWISSEYESMQAMYSKGFRFDLAPDPEELWVDPAGTLYRDYYGEWQRCRRPGAWERSAYANKQEYDAYHNELEAVSD